MLNSMVKKSILCILFSGLAVQPMHAMSQGWFSDVMNNPWLKVAGFTAAAGGLAGIYAWYTNEQFKAKNIKKVEVEGNGECLYTDESMIVQTNLVPKDACKELYRQFPHDQSKYPHSHVDPKDPAEVVKYSSPNAYKELFEQDFYGKRIYPVRLFITNTSDKPLYLSQDSIKMQKPSEDSKQCLLDRSEVSIRRKAWLIMGCIMPVIGFIFAYKPIIDEIGYFLDEYEISADGLTLEPGQTFKTIVFVEDDRLSTQALIPASFTFDFKVYSQLSWYGKKYTQVQAQIINAI